MAALTCMGKLHELSFFGYLLLEYECRTIILSAGHALIQFNETHESMITPFLTAVMIASKGQRLYIAFFNL